MAESLKLRGRICFISDLVSGVSKSGTSWVKKTFAIETLDQYPKRVAFTLFNDRTDIYVELNRIVDVYFDAESREFNGRWYTDLRAWKVEDPNEARQNQPKSNDGFPW